MKGVSPVVSYAMPIVFFFSILVAALTSEISMLEVIVEYFVTEKKLSRKKATLVGFSINYIGKYNDADAALKSMKKSFAKRLDEGDIEAVEE